jgi:hypothetical protein
VCEDSKSKREMTNPTNRMDQHPRVPHKPDNEMHENSQENLDRKLDHAGKESFPTSDPVSVTITKGGAIHYDNEGNAVQPASKITTGGVRRAAEALLKEVTSTASEMADRASAVAREAYGQGRGCARAAGERYPTAQRYYRDGTQAVRQQAAVYPILTLVVGVGIGYVLARAIHSGRLDRAEDVPEYGRTERATRMVI